jgi:hypothetical protein
LPVAENELDNWIDYAQIKSIDEIMLEILDGDEDVLFCYVILLRLEHQKI